MLMVVASNPVWLCEILILMKRDHPLLEHLDNQHNIKLIITGTTKLVLYNKRYYNAVGNQVYAQNHHN
jgi:hypothetical protein